MNIFHCGSVRFPGGHRVRDRNQPIFAKRTTYISRRPAARICRALVFALAFSLALGFVSSGNDAAAGDIVVASNQGSISVFGAEGMKVKNSKPFRGWDTMLARYAKQEARLAKGGGRINEKNGSKLWDDMIASLRGLEPTTQIRKVNRYFNKLTYQSDAKTYAAKDYWATPYQFLSRAKGDCEDFAAAKYFALRALGFDSSQLRLVVGYDHTRRAAHTVTLAVVNGHAMILDIGDNPIVDMAVMTRFDPLYSVTESAGWLYVKRA